MVPVIARSRLEAIMAKAAVIREGLQNPHGVVRASDRYVISNTRKGHVDLLDNQLNLIEQYDFSSFPIPDASRDVGNEWLQHTNPVGNGLLATVDSRRGRVIVWDPKSRIYSEYPINPHWWVQSVEGYSP